MKKVKGNIKKTNKDGSKETEDLFTYSEEEKQQNKINAANTKLLYTPEFIPFYPEIQKKFDLTDKETLMYGFIRFYLSTANKDGRFYFSNKQLAKLLGVSKKHITNIIKGLKKKMGLPVKYRVSEGGGTTRFINKKDLRLEPQWTSDSSEISEASESSSQKPAKVLPNNNKINNNITSNKRNTLITRENSKKKKEFGNKKVNQIITALKEKLKLPVLDGSQKVNRQYAWHLLKKHESVENVVRLIELAAQDEWYRNNITSTKDLYYKGVKLIARRRGDSNGRVATL